VKRAKRKISVQPQSGLNADINITPMVDVALVLLIIFMVFTPLRERDVEVQVPETEKVETPEQVPPNQLVVNVLADGRVRINDEDVSDAQYVERLGVLLAAKKPGERLVFFTGEGQSRYGKLVAVIDGARQAGAEELGLATDE
jgi:biopolymer transport protein ExbD/biopolymer transport protein TolR